MVDNKLSSELLLKVEKITPVRLRVPLGELGAVVRLAVRDTKTGKVEFEKEFVSHSFVKQFLQYLWLHFEGQTSSSWASASMKDTAGASWTHAFVHYENLKVNAPVNNDLFGIQTGLSNAVPTITDFRLASKISHGIGLNNLQYGAVAFGAPSDDGVTSQFTVTRDFANASGNPITVEEIGLVTSRDKYYLLIRDTTGAIVVPNGKTLTVNYQIEANV